MLSLKLRVAKRGKYVVEDIFFILTGTLIILNTASVYYTQNPHVFMICNVFSLTISCILLFSNLSMRIQKKYLMYILVYGLSVFLLLAMWQSISAYYFYVMGIVYPLEFILIVLLVKSKKLVKFIDVLLKVCVCVALFSIGVWIFGSIFRLVLPSGTAIFQWGSETRTVNTYYNLYFETQNAGLDIGKIHIGVRNNSIFAEAPMCCFVFVCASLLNELFIQSRKYRYIFLIMILSTLTTTGILYVALYIICYIVKTKPYKVGLRMVKYTLLIVISIISLAVIEELIFKKFTTISGVDRISHIVQEINGFKKHPVIGSGFDVYTKGSSNSITALLADGGVLLWLLFYGPILKRIFSIKRSNRKIFYIAFLFMCVFSITAVQYSPFAIFMINSFLIVKQNECTKKGFLV